MFRWSANDLLAVLFISFQPNYTAVAETCNTFRVYGDIYDSFQSIESIMSWYADDDGQFIEVAGPGSFTDADMVMTRYKFKGQVSSNFNLLNRYKILVQWTRFARLRPYSH